MLSRWDNTRFYNIWMITELDNNNGEDGGTVTFIYFGGISETMMVLLF
jgi:hypothetical protein